MAFLPASELLSRTSFHIMEILEAARHVLIEKENFGCLSACLGNIHLILQEIQADGIEDPDTFRSAMECLENEVKNAKDLMETYKIKSRFYLLINSRFLLETVKKMMGEIGHAFSLIPLSHLDLSIEIKRKAMLLVKQIQYVEFKTSHAVEEVANKIKTGLQDYRESTNFSNERFLVAIAEVVGVDLNPLSLKKELEKLKKEKEVAELEKNEAEALQLQRILALLSWADIAYSRKEREKQFMDKRGVVGSHPFPPLHSFYCPITQEVMEDPVEVASGHAFDRKAIQKWFAEGHTMCPLSLVELQHLDLKPNTILKRSIEEWKTRNLQFRLTSMGSKLNSEDEAIVFGTLEELYELCEAKSVDGHWIAAEGLVPVLVNLLKSSKSAIRKKTFTTLTMLIKGNLDNKVRACEAGVITFAVRSLAREMLESRQAVSLLLELSKEQKLCKQLTKTQGCVLLLVTMTTSEVRQAAEDAQMVLENLAKNKDHNVILMAEANYFKPLVQRMHEGLDMTQILMANTITEMQLTDYSRRALVQLGVLDPLVKMLSEGNFELKSASLGALQNLSKLSRNRDDIVNAGVVRLLLEILFTSKSILMTMKEQAADVFANLATTKNTSSGDSYCDLLGNGPELNETIYQLLSLLHLSGSLLQARLLQALVGLSSPLCARVLRETMREAGYIEVLVSFYMVTADAEARLYALKLLYVVTQDGGGQTLANEMGVKPLQSLVDLLMLESSRDDVKSSVMGILQHIPVDNNSITELMVEGGLLQMVLEILQKAASKDCIKQELLENTVGVLVRFTSPSNVSLQQYVAEKGIIPVLLRLLRSGSHVTKCRAAISLGQLSESTLKTTCHFSKKKEHGRFWCFGHSSPQLLEDLCKVHGGMCSIEKSFCLLEAHALPLLIKTLEEKEPAVVEAALGALATLLYDEFWEKGADAIAEERGVGPIVRLLTTGTPRVQESALWILERFFRRNTFREKYGNMAQMALISLTQDGTNKARHYAARILAHLNILQEQSSYF